MPKSSRSFFRPFVLLIYGPQSNPACRQLLYASTQCDPFTTSDNGFLVFQGGELQHCKIGIRTDMRPFQQIGRNVPSPQRGAAQGLRRVTPHKGYD